MSAYELYTSHLNALGGHGRLIENSDYVIIGIPFDSTSTYRRGAKFAPLAIREAFQNIETHSIRSDIDFHDLRIYDLGDLHVSNCTDITLKRLESVIRDLIKTAKIPVLLGGEHTLTLGAMRGVGGEGTALVSFDAHLDMRDEYLGCKTSHATFIRRLHESVKPEKVIVIGVRALCKEELHYAKKSDIQFFSTEQIRKNSLKRIINSTKQSLRNCKKVYISIDMDVLDPAFAPAVQNPEPEGLSTTTLIDFIFNICDSRTVCLDLSEVTPLYDNGNTSIQAAKIIFETLCKIESLNSD